MSSVLPIDTPFGFTARRLLISCLLSFLSRPPSLSVLEQRLRDRGTETEASLEKRLTTARLELEYGAEPGNFDIVITNDDLDKAYQELRWDRQGGKGKATISGSASIIQSGENLLYCLR